MKTIFPEQYDIAIIGLGYVGLPLATAFGAKYSVTGFDINEQRISELQKGEDATGEVSSDEFDAAAGLRFTGSISDISKCNIFIITVPTPIDGENNPDLTPLISASTLVGKILKEGDIVIYESTVFPGATEEVCVPLLEHHSGLTFANEENSSDTGVFYAGYSPERINPGDKLHRVTDIVKVTSGSTPEVAEFIDKLYGSVIVAGTYRAESVRTAEAAKVIENIQRDVNIALINELAILFDKLDLDTEAVLNAAGTKWNFLPFRPGLVGGHCIGVDPYYLTHKAEQIGHHPEIILAGRRINNQMSQYACDRIIALMLSHKIEVVGAKILVLGLTFKENCPDTRNSKVVDLVNSLVACNADVNVYDPHVKPEEVPADVNGHFISAPEKAHYDCIVLAVSHSDFISMGVEKIREFGREKHVLFDMKYAFEKGSSDARL